MSDASRTAVGTTRLRTIAAALELFGARGIDAVSLDDIAVVVGVRKQTVLYWFATKDELVDAVFADAAARLAVTAEAAIRAAPADPLDHVDSVVVAAFRAAVRTPSILGLIRELNRLPEPRAPAPPTPHPAARRSGRRVPRRRDGRRPAAPRRSPPASPCCWRRR